MRGAFLDSQESIDFSASCPWSVRPSRWSAQGQRMRRRCRYSRPHAIAIRAVAGNVDDTADSPKARLATVVAAVHADLRLSQVSRRTSKPVRCSTRRPSSRSRCRPASLSPRRKLGAAGGNVRRRHRCGIESTRVAAAVVRADAVVVIGLGRRDRRPRSSVVPAPRLAISAKPRRRRNVELEARLVTRVVRPGARHTGRRSRLGCE